MTYNFQHRDNPQDMIAVEADSLAEARIELWEVVLYLPGLFPKDYRLMSITKVSLKQFQVGTYENYLK